jgi:hypothetical protein
MSSRFTTRRVYAAGIGIAIALAVMRMFGLSVADLALLARATFVEAAADAKAVVSGEYTERVARRLREEAASIPEVAPTAGGKETIEVSREVQAERRRIVEERADNLQKVGKGLVTGDLEWLKKQADENARRAGGGN